jgi:hypothetical protein
MIIKLRKELNSMQDKKTNINSVEVFYNQDNEKFDKFLQSVVRDYVSEDITEPDEEDEDFSMTIA